MARTLGSWERCKKKHASWRQISRRRSKTGLLEGPKRDFGGDWWLNMGFFGINIGFHGMDVVTRYSGDIYWDHNGPTSHIQYHSSEIGGGPSQLWSWTPGFRGSLFSDTPLVGTSQQHRIPQDPWPWSIIMTYTMHDASPLIMHVPRANQFLPLWNCEPSIIQAGMMVNARGIIPKWPHLSYFQVAQLLQFQIWSFQMGLVNRKSIRTWEMTS